jgi:carboxyl-terminal processing protease
VRVTIRPGGEGETREVTLRRARVNMPSVVDVEMLDAAAGIGYMHLTVFAANSEGEVRKAIRRLGREGLKALILDLRDNPGGYLDSGVGVVGAFLAKGRVVETRGRMPGASWKFDVPLFDRVEWAGPLAVLVNADSASAAELTAAALKRHHRATLLGRRTFGKGAVQINIPISGESAVSVTIARVYDPSGECLEGAGVTPDREVPEPPSVPDDMRDDPVVRAAMDALARPVEAPRAAM